jgi:hypothetical protein
MAMTRKKWISLAESEIKGAERAAAHLSEALNEHLKYGRKYTAGLFHYLGEETTRAADKSYRQVGKEIREGGKWLKSAKRRLDQQVKARRAQLARAKKKLKG